MHKSSARESKEMRKYEYVDPTKVLSTYDEMKSYDPSEKEVEQSIEEGFSKISLNYRSQVAQEVDGTICMALKETPEKVEASLARLQIELNSIPYKKKVAFNQSQQLPTTYINDASFRLRFLRSQLFNEREAALLLVKYCDYILEVFGSFALERHIRFNDLSKHEIKWLMKGYIQLMPFRDMFGRRVVMQIMDSNVLIEQLSRLKLYIYIAMVLSSDAETQQKGIVIVVFPGGPANDWKRKQRGDPRIWHLIRQRHKALPIRITGYHYCMPDHPVFRLIRSFAMLYGGIGGGIKSRMKFHVGKDTELRYALQRYGIPVDLLPVTGTGNIKLNSLKQWINVRKIVENEKDARNNPLLRNSPIEEFVECPGSNDVIFKPGKRLTIHPGNMLFQELVLSKENEYTTTSSKRGLYRWLIMEITRKRNGRFLVWNDGGYWTELTELNHITVKISTSCKAVLGKAKKRKILVDSSTSAFMTNFDERSECNSCGNKKRCDGLGLFDTTT